MKTSGNKLYNIIQKGNAILYKLLISFSVFCCIFLSNQSYNRRLRNLLPNLILLPIGILLFTLLWLLCRNVKKNNHRSTIIVCISSVLFMVIQIFCVYSYYFLSGWDVYVIRISSLSLSGGNLTTLQEMSSYISQYPNNRLMITIFAMISRLAESIFKLSNTYFPQIVFLCGLSAVTGVLLYLLTKNLTKDDRISIFVYVIYLLFVGISPWVSIPYSDSLGLFFPVCIITLYFYIDDDHNNCTDTQGENDDDNRNSKNALRLKNSIRWAAIVFLTILGFEIKPQIAIVSIAIVIMEISKLFLPGRIKAKGILFNVIGAAAGFGLAVLILVNANAMIAIEVNDEAAFGVSHYVMMGLNQEKNGAYSKDDVLYSQSYPTRKLRSKANMEKAGERVREMGIPGLVKHLVKKTLSNCNDGTFTWGWEGKFIYEEFEDTTPASRLLKNIYYRDPEGAYYKYWCNYAQVIWITLLFFSCFSGLLIHTRKWNVVLLSLTGLILFGLLFEARARYFYHYTPLFILTGAIGFRLVFERVRSYCMHRRSAQS